LLMPLTRLGHQIANCPKPAKSKDTKDATIEMRSTLLRQNRNETHEINITWKLKN